MTGYVESLTDPSYAGQILTFTFPLIGNYGVPERILWESDKIHARGAIFSSLTSHTSHYQAKQTLAAWLEKQKVPFLTGVDTRALTKTLRTQGIALGVVTHGDKKPATFVDPNATNLVEMASTGEAACLGGNFIEAFFSSWMATDQMVRRKKMLVSIGGKKKIKLLEALKNLEEKGWDLYATEGTHDFLSRHGVASRCVYKGSEKIEPNVSTLLIQKDVDLIINIPRGTNSHIQTDGFTIRRLAIDHHIPLMTNLQTAQLLLQALSDLKPEQISVRSYKEFMKSRDSGYTKKLPKRLEGLQLQHKI